MRSAIGLLLLGSALIGGCDRQSAPGSQAKQSHAPVKLDKLDRTHKGEPAPATPFLDPAGKQTSLAAFKGKPVLLNLWATWCIPCVKEMPTLDALAEQKGGALPIVTLSQDMKGREVVAPYFAKAGFKHLRPWLDADMAMSMGMNLNLPTTILYDSAGKEVWRVTGELDWTGPEAAALLAEAR